MEAVQVRPPDQSEPGDEPTDGASPAPEVPTADFVTCYELHYRRLVLALELAGADRSTAEDVAQEAFSRALVHWWRIKRGPNPPGYVYTAGFRLLARARRRSPGKEIQGGLAHGEAGSSSSGASGGVRSGGPDPTAAAATSSVAVHSALSAMPPRRRECAVMCLVVGLPVGDAAEALGIASGTVRKHLDEARKDLAAVFGDPGD